MAAILKNPDKYYDKVERVGGWVKKIRAQQTNIFIDLNDGSSVRNLQVVISQSYPDFENIKQQTLSSCLEVVGRLVRSPAAGQPIEMLIDDSAAGH